MARRPAATAADTLAAIRRDPVVFCREVLGFEPWSKQREILNSVRDHRRTAVRSAHGVGKTRTAAAAALWFLAAHPRSKVLTTAPTWHQVRRQLWAEIATLHHAAAGFIDGRLSETRLDLGPDWFALGLSTDRPERFQGYHGENLLLIVDEASGVDERLYEAAWGFLTSAGARVLLIGNPTALSGTFHEAFHRQRAAWNTIAISALDSPNFTRERVPRAARRALVSREWADAARTRWGEQSPLYEVRVLGRFPTAGDDTVIGVADVEAAQLRTAEPGLPVVVGVDVARFGSDETVIAVRQGQHVRIARTHTGKDTMETAGHVLRIARDVFARTAARPTVVVDDAGVGGGVTDRLREQQVSVRAFNGASTSGSRDYPNRRSEAWFRFAEQLPGVDLDADEQLAADLTAPRYTLDSRGRRVVEPKSETKKRLGRSPDRADAVLLCFADRAAATTTWWHPALDALPASTAYSDGPAWRSSSGRLSPHTPRYGEPT